MTMRIVDAGPLLFLARLNRLEILKIGASRVLVPSAVLIEIQKKNDLAMEIIHASYGNWLGECLITDPEILKMLPDLGKGEREIIAQAIEQKINSVVLDDLDARRIARRFGLIPTGQLVFYWQLRKKAFFLHLKRNWIVSKRWGFGYQNLY